MPSTRRTTRASLRTSATVQAQAPASVDVDIEVQEEAGHSRRPRKRVKVEEVYAEAVEEMMDGVEAPTKKPRKRKSTVVEANSAPSDSCSPSTKASKPRAKAPPKPLQYDSSSFLPRVQSPWKVGAHVSASGGIENAVVNAAMIGANAFALFLKSQRKWSSPPLTPSSISLFKERMKEFGYEAKYVLPHGSYLVNLGNPDKEKREKSYDCFVDDLKRCEALGLQFYNFHPGSSLGQTPRLVSIAHIADGVNRAHAEVGGVVVVLENMAGAGNVIGSTFEDIAAIIERVEDKERVGVCFDTCHAYAAGYDISTPEGWEKTMKEFDEVIGMKYLCGMHLNDSKTPCGSRKDRHESVGLGTLGLEAFHTILTDPRTQDVPLILETPSYERPVEVWGVEVGVLNALSGMGQEPEADGNDDEGEVEGTGKGVKEKRTVEELGEEVRCAVGKASLEVDAKKAKAKAKVVDGGKRKRKVKAKGEEEGEEECEEGDEEERDV